MANSAQLRNEIAAGKWDDKLRALYGDAAQEICRQRARYCAALEQFELYFGPGRQVQVYSAPGRAELGGNHTDHQHGYGLAAAVTLDLVAVAAHNTDGYVRVKSRGFNKLDVIDLTVEGPQEGESTHSASLIRGIAEGFRAAGKAVGGFDAYTASDVLRGSGLSSSAAFEMGMAAIWNGEYGCGLAPAELAKICQYAENTYFGKPSGLLDQLTSAVGGIIFADFADPQQPVLEKIHADGLLPPGMSLCVTDTRGSHSELTGEFAAIRQEMEQIAAFLGKKVLGQVTESAFWAALPALRKACGDRAVLRAIHYYEENARTIVSTWGDKDQSLNDYANRTWGGLVSGYYAPRWEMFIDEVIRSVSNKQPFNADAFHQRVTQFEIDWVKSHERYPSEPVGNAVEIATLLMNKYKDSILKEKHNENN